jgi:hypothetical protein
MDWLDYSAQANASDKMVSLGIAARHDLLLSS